MVLFEHDDPPCRCDGGEEGRVGRWAAGGRAATGERRPEAAAAARLLAANPMAERVHDRKLVRACHCGGTAQQSTPERGSQEAELQRGYPRTAQALHATLALRCIAGDIQEQQAERDCRVPVAGHVLRAASNENPPQGVARRWQGSQLLRARWGTEPGWLQTK